MYLYSVKSTEMLRTFAATFSKFMDLYFPDIRYVKDITSEHVQLYIDQRISTWTDKTLSNQKDRFRKIEAICNNIYQTKLDFSKVNYTKNKTGVIRNHPMKTDDFIRFMETIWFVSKKKPLLPLLTATAGTRIEELILISPDEIDLENHCIHLTHCKNGRDRTVNIAPEYLFIWERVKTESKKKNWKTISNIKVHSYSDFLNKYKKKAGITEKYPNEGNHAIRKMYARRRFAEEQLKGLPPEEAWINVQVELGHGNHNRPELFLAYIGQSFKSYMKDYEDNGNQPVLDLNDLKKQVDYILSFKERLN